MQGQVHALTQEVLRTDVAGMPLEWIDYRVAATLYHSDQVAYACGSPLYRIRGGYCAKSGDRSIIEVSSIIATHGDTRTLERFYLPAEDVRMDLLEPSEKQTRCAYKGVASYWHVRLGDTLHQDLAWTYEEPDDDGRAIRGLICFFNERVDLEVDGQVQERPPTQWSH